MCQWLYLQHLSQSSCQARQLRTHIVPRIKFLAALVKNATLVGARARYTAASLGLSARAHVEHTSITMAQPLRLNPRAFAACASWLDAAEDDAAATAPEAPRPTGPRAGLGAAPRARKTQQDASLAARIARDDRKRGGGRGGGRGRRRGDDSDDDAAGSASDDSDDEGESRYGRGRAAAAAPHASSAARSRAAAAPHASSRKRRRKNE